MDADKRKIIVQEIDRWRRSKLLPEQYCDFLLNLYLDEDTPREKFSWNGLSSTSILNSHWRAWVFIFGSVGLISMFLLNFNAFSQPMQIGVSLLFVATCYMLGAVQRNKQPLVSQLTFGVGSLLLLYLGIYWQAHGTHGEAFIALYVAGCSVVWMVTGVLARLPLFHLAGWIVLMLLYGWFLHEHISNFDWIGVEMSWIPLSAVLLWLGWLFHHNNKQIGLVLLVVGLLVWFVPEIYGMILTDIAAEALQLLFLAKVAAAGIALFVWRKNWIEWVA